MTGRARRQQRKRARAQGPAPLLSKAKFAALYAAGWAYNGRGIWRMPGHCSWALRPRWAGPVRP